MPPSSPAIPNKTYLGVDATTHTSEQGNGGSTQTVASDGLEDAPPVVSVELETAAAAATMGSTLRQQDQQHMTLLQDAIV
jgi:hypothetical protein